MMGSQKASLVITGRILEVLTHDASTGSGEGGDTEDRGRRC